MRKRLDTCDRSGGRACRQPPNGGRIRRQSAGAIRTEPVLTKAEEAEVKKAC